RGATPFPYPTLFRSQINKNKRSVALDLRRDEGREVFWRLLATADVFIDGNAADAMTKLGVGYEQQKARRAEIVYCQYTGYGATRSEEHTSELQSREK